MELKPCPWCGSQIVDATVSEGSTFRWRKVDGCCTDGPEIRHDTLAKDQKAAEIESREKAIAAWNTRPEAAPSPSDAKGELCRWFVSGPEGAFFVNDNADAEAVIRLAGFDRDDWTITDLQNPTGAAAIDAARDAEVGRWILMAMAKRAEQAEAKLAECGELVKRWRGEDAAYSCDACADKDKCADELAAALAGRGDG